MCMRYGICGALLTAALALPATAGSRVYAGDEAAALRCAAEFSYSAHVLSRQGLMSDHHRQVATKTSYYLLEHHVSGSFEDKLGAYEGVLAGMPLDDPDRVHASVLRMAECEKRFLQQRP